MSLISAKDQDYLKGYFAKELAGDVRLVYFTQRESRLFVPGQECQFCKETRQLLEEIGTLPPKIQLEVHDFVAEDAAAQAYGVDKIPATIIAGAAKGHPLGLRVRHPRREHRGCLPGPDQPRPSHQDRAGQGEQARPHPGLRHPYLTVLPHGGQVGLQDGR